MNKAISTYAHALLGAVQKRMYGVEEITRLSLVALYSGGHVLLEGNPGMGKTELVKTLAGVLRFPFGRIQFTPDLMPADITGTYMPDPEKPGGALAFRPGPVFTSLLLADEINRATPKTQSAMLEAMAEKQVTVLGEVRPLEAPFMVLATQNPIDQEGTYNLPEAQADRFMFKLIMPDPDPSTLRRIFAKTTGALAQQLPDQDPGQTRLLPQDREDSLRKYQELRARIESVVPLPSLEAHVINLLQASNGRYQALEGLDKPQLERLKRLGELLTYGLGPRAGIAMMLGAKAEALLFSNHAGEFADGPALAEVVIPVLRHRLKLELDWDERYRTMVERPSPQEHTLLEKLMTDFCLAAAPKQGEYQTTVKNALRLRPYSAGEKW